MELNQLIIANCPNSNYKNECAIESLFKGERVFCKDIEVCPESINRRQRYSHKVYPKRNFKTEQKPPTVPLEMGEVIPEPAEDKQTKSNNDPDPQITKDLFDFSKG